MDDRIRPARVGVLLQKMIKAFERERADRLLLLGIFCITAPATTCRRAMPPQGGHPAPERAEAGAFVRAGQL